MLSVFTALDVEGTGVVPIATCILSFNAEAYPGVTAGAKQRWRRDGVQRWRHDGAQRWRRNGAQRDEVYGENVVSLMLVDGRWKYVRYEWGANAEQLYDLSMDPGETRNHAGDPANAAVLAGMRVRLDRQIAAHAALRLTPADHQPGVVYE